MNPAADPMSGSVRTMQRTPVRKLIATSAALVLGLAVVSGCGGSDSSGSGDSNAGKSSAAKVYGPGDDIVVDDGQTFVVALESNPTTGYEWSAAANPNAEFVKSEQATSSTLVGAPGTQRLTFRATAAGSSTLTLSYARSFEPGVPPVRTEAFPLTVK